MFKVQASLLLAILLGCCIAHGSETAGSGTISSDQFELDYLIEGNGTPAIVIGFPRYYSRVLSQELRSNLKLVFVDHRGSAPSPGPVPVSEFSLEKISDDIELIRTTLDLGKIAIIGHSGHALMALEYAKRYPDSVNHVVMIGVAPNLGPKNTAARDEHWDTTASVARKEALERNWEGHEGSATDESHPGEGFIQTYVKNGPMAWYDYDFDATPLWRGVEINMDMFNHVWGKLLAELDITNGLTGFDRPVFLALGRHDYLVAPPSSWDSVASQFEDLVIRVYQSSGHTPPYEEPDAFNKDLLDWMTRTQSKT